MKKALLVLLAVSLFVVVYLSINLKEDSGNNIVTNIIPSGIKDTIMKKDVSNEIKTFESEEDFKKYIAQNTESYDYYSSNDFFMEERDMLVKTATPEFSGSPSLDSVSFNNSTSTRFEDTRSSKSARSSKTNVQVVGIDEPDIVKTDGKNIFLSHENYNFPQQFTEPVIFDEINTKENLVTNTKIAPPAQINKGVHTIQAIPPGDMKIINDLDVHGDLLLEKKNLVVLGDKQIYGYDISNPNSERKWNIGINEDVQIETARLSNDILYILTKTRIKPSAPCPIRPLKVNGADMIIPCNTINHPVKPVSANITYSLMKINVKTGDLKGELSFIGSQGSVVTYMSPENFYVSYPNRKNESDFMLEFVLNSSFLPTDLKEKLRKIGNYDISSESKEIEFEMILETFTNSLSEDEQLAFENNAENEAANYLEKNIRKMEDSTIAKISLKKLKVDSVGTVPGHLLNQFSMDEYKGNLRVATTVEPIIGDIDSVNDVYVLDKKMNILGSAINMGKDERIYSVRFIGNKGYVVTFRETDPFYVLDLKNPKSPKITGELKIPGYSAYLHQLEENLILGIGKEDGKVKLSAFDVSDVNNPKETSKYMLDEYYSEAVNNHHAFLLDDKHKIFFLPGSKGGYIFTFENGKLEMKKAISVTGVSRALYINDYLYIISDDKITVINENDWQKVQDFSMYNAN